LQAGEGEAREAIEEDALEHAYTVYVGGAAAGGGAELALGVPARLLSIFKEAVKQGVEQAKQVETGKAPEQMTPEEAKWIDEAVRDALKVMADEAYENGRNLLLSIAGGHVSMNELNEKHTKKG
jgi:hypothetical protein